MLNFMTASKPSPTQEFAAVFAGAGSKVLVPTVPAPPMPKGKIGNGGNGGSAPYKRKAKEARTVPVSLRMTPTVKSMADKLADDLEISLADVIHKALIAFHAQNEKA
jgi:hypothetical protein